VPSSVTVQVWSSRAAGPVDWISVQAINPANDGAAVEVASDGEAVAALDGDGVADTDAGSLGAAEVVGDLAVQLASTSTMAAAGIARPLMVDRLRQRSSCASAIMMPSGPRT
jgi:hypothetical protein